MTRVPINSEFSQEIVSDAEKQTEISECYICEVCGREAKSPQGLRVHMAVHKRAGDTTSPPARGRGLKQDAAFQLLAEEESPPARGRGLKLISIKKLLKSQGRPLRGGVD